VAAEPASRPVRLRIQEDENLLVRIHDGQPAAVGAVSPHRSDSRARISGGLANFGTLSLTRVTICGNSARVGSGLFSSRKAPLIARWILTSLSP
jgi:hypothetical protein